MNNARNNKAFTLIEVMLAAAILLIGLILVAGAFPVGIKFTAIATERVIGSVAAQEAAAKVYLYGEPNTIGQPPFGFDFAKLPVGYLVDFADLAYDSTTDPWAFHSILTEPLQRDFDPAQFWYPSEDSDSDKLYHWSVLLKRHSAFSATDIDAVIFVSRIGNAGAMYPNPYYLTYPATYPDEFIPVPKPLAFPLDTSLLPDPAADIDTLQIDLTDPATLALINDIPDRAVIVILDAYHASKYDIMLLEIEEVNRVTGTIKLSREVSSDKIDMAAPAARVGNYFWVIPTADGSSRNPCVAVYPHTFSF